LKLLVALWTSAFRVRRLTPGCAAFPQRGASSTGVQPDPEGRQLAPTTSRAWMLLHILCFKEVLCASVRIIRFVAFCRELRPAAGKALFRAAT
jgi:hypothetical protein